jgi:hypothetical protein
VWQVVHRTTSIPTADRTIAEFSFQPLKAELAPYTVRLPDVSGHTVTVRANAMNVLLIAAQSVFQRHQSCVASCTYVTYGGRHSYIAAAMLGAEMVSTNHTQPW